MTNFMKQVLFFLASTFSASIARPTLPYTFSTKAITGLGNGISSKITTHLYSKNSGMFIRINTNSVDGAGNRSDPNATIILQSAGFNGQVHIKSSDGSRYLCMSGHGSLTVVNKKQGAKQLVSCIFYQKQHSNGYTVYQSKRNANWYLGIRGNGSPKSAKKTSYSQRAAHFLELD